MAEDLQPGDFLVFQLESGFGLLRLLDKTVSNASSVWHLASYENLFLDVDSAEAAAEIGVGLKTSHPHLALTNRAFESTQVARILNQPLSEDEKTRVEAWNSDPNNQPSDRSVRLLLGLR